jgi:ATP-dependent protease HslVU (ClpYQ) peptidase subunit
MIDKIHRDLSCDMIVSDPQMTIYINGSGDAIEIEEGVVAIGSGALYAHGEFVFF